MNTEPAKSNLMRMTDKEFETLSSYVKSQYGIDLTKKRTLIEGRLTNELRSRGFTTFQAYFDALFKDKSGTEITNLLNKLTTNLSFFMRENEHFEFMFNQILPALEKTRSNHDIRIWSAGCSTGQEPYNMAMVIDEYFGPRKGTWDTTILATDISMKVLTKAQKGVYTAEDVKGLPAKWKTKYFKALPDGTFEVCDKIKKEIVFRPFNLMDPFRFKKPFDLIFCRNVMIYFDAPTKENLVKKFYDWTANGGYFFIGHSESINGTHSRYTYIQPAIYQKKG